MKQIVNRVFYIEYKAQYKRYPKSKPTKLKRLGAFIDGCILGKHKKFGHPYLKYHDFKKKDFRTASVKFKLTDPKTKRILLKVG